MKKNNGEDKKNQDELLWMKVGWDERILQNDEGNEQGRTQAKPSCVLIHSPPLSVGFAPISSPGPVARPN